VFGERVTGLPADPYLDLPLSPVYSLRIGYFWRASKSEEYVMATRLLLRHKDSGKDILLGWRQDDGHVHPHVLRWEEADLIGRLQALRDPELPHPGIPFLLLLPYIAPVEGSDHLLGLGLLNSALRSLGVFNERQIRYRLSTFDLVPADGEWRQVRPYGWVCYCTLAEDWWMRGDRMIHSLRQVPEEQADDSLGFPFDAWNDCMRHAERVVAEAPQALVRKARTEPLPELSERIELYYQVTECAEAYSTVPVLRRALFEEALGVFGTSTGWFAFEGPDNPQAEFGDANRGVEYTIVCHGELAEILTLFRRVVEEAGRPDVRLYQRMYGANSPPFRRIAL
jgi:hypothetical protein